MILVCHDLNMFSERSRHNATGWRLEIIEKMIQLLKTKKPILMIQHPHNTDSFRIWSTALGGLSKELPGIKYVSSGKYYYYDHEQISPLDKVLERTKNVPTIDFVIMENNKI